MSANGLTGSQADMTLTFTILSVMTIASAVAAMSLRNLVHCALALVVTFVGLAALYLQLGAQFVGLAQILVYVGAVTILIVFAILLTRGGEPAKQSVFSPSWIFGMGVAVAVISILVWAINHSVVMKSDVPPPPSVTVKQIGDALMNKFVLPLEVVGLLLTTALIGAVILALREKKPELKSQKSEVGAKVEAPDSLANRKSQIANH
jgi:NADH-quinone oxidoreductase subunit J